MSRINLPTAAWVKPGITVLSVTAITTIGFAAPAGASTRHPLPVPSASSYRAMLGAIRTALTTHQSAHDVGNFGGIPVIPGTGSGQQSSPQFGGGKEVVHVEAMPGTFPADMTPDLTKITFNFHQVMTDGTNTQVVDTDCNNNSSGPDDPFTPCANADAPLQLDVPFSILYDAAHSTLPSGFVAPATATDTVSSSLPPFTPAAAPQFSAHALPGTLPDACGSVSNSPPVLICSHNVTVQIPGTWRPVGLTLTNKATGAPLAHSAFVLSQGATTLGTATTDSKGHIKFPGIYQGGNFTLEQKSTPAGFAGIAGPFAFKVPAVTTAAQAGKEYDAHVKLAPLPPTAVNDAVSTAQDRAKVVKVLSNDKAVSAPLTIATVGKPQHGTAVANPDGTVTYKPAAGFAGTDTFTYSVRNALGGVASATVTVTVTRSSVLGDRLAMTGQTSALEAEVGFGSLLVGALLIVAGRRRRSGQPAA